MSVSTTTGLHSVIGPPSGFQSKELTVVSPPAVPLARNVDAAVSLVVSDGTSGKDSADGTWKPSEPPSTAPTGNASGASTPGGTPTTAASQQPPATAPSTTQTTPTAAPAPAPPPAAYVVPPLDQSAHPTLNAHQMETISVLQRHRDSMPLKLKDLAALIAAPGTPPDLKQALQDLANDPTLTQMLDAVPDKKGKRSLDGKCGTKELDFVASWPEIAKYNADKATTYTQNYVTSESKDPAPATVREITANDAAREMYLYSDNLPKTLDPPALQAIVDGQGKGGKCPPQVVAAAKFYLDHPEEWGKLTVGKNGQPSAGGKVDRGAMLDTIAATVFLTSEEESTLKTIGEHQDVFFAKPLDRKRAQAIVDDPASPPDIKAAARKLLDDPLLFGMIDNAKKGHTPRKHNKADDGKFGAADYNKFEAQLRTKNLTPPTLPPAKTPDTPEARKALADMQNGAIDSPAQKKAKGGGGVFGGLKNFFKHTIGGPIVKTAKTVAKFAKDKVLPELKKAGKAVWHFVQTVGAQMLKIYSQVADIAALVLSACSKIPIIGEFTMAISMALEVTAAAAVIGVAALRGTSMVKAAEEAAMRIGGMVLSNVIAPGAGKAIMKGAAAVGATVAIDAAVGAATTAGKSAAKSAGKGISTGVDKGLVKTGLRTQEQIEMKAAQKLETKELMKDTTLLQKTKVFTRMSSAEVESAKAADNQVTKELMKDTTRWQKAKVFTKFSDAEVEGAKAAEKQAAKDVMKDTTLWQKAKVLLNESSAEVEGAKATEKATTKAAEKEAREEATRYAPNRFVRTYRAVSQKTGFSTAEENGAKNATDRAANKLAAERPGIAERISTKTQDKVSELKCKLGLSTPEKEADAAAVRAERKAAEKEAAEKEAAVKKAGKKEAKKEAKRDLKDKIKDFMENLLQNVSNVFSSFMSGGGDDIALEMERNRRMQKAMNENRTATSKNDLPTNITAVVQQSLKATQKAI